MLKRSHQIILFTVGFLMAALVGAYLYLPRYVETRLIPQVVQAAGLTIKTARVGAIGFTGADLGPIQIESGATAALSVERLHLAYSPLTLWHRKLDHIRLQGLTFSLRLADGKLWLGDRAITPGADDSPAAATAAIPPLPFRHLAVENGVAQIAWVGGTARVPFNIDVTVGEGREGIAVAGRCTLTEASAVDTAHRVEAEKIDLDIPFAWPALPQAAPGRIAVGEISWRNQALGDLRGAVQQNGMGLRFDLTHGSRLLSDLIVKLSGTASGESAEVFFDLPEYRPVAPIDLGRFAPDAAGVLFSGRLAVQGDVRWKPANIRASADLRIEEGQLNDAGRGLEIASIDTRLRMEDLLAPRSASGQHITIQRVQWGNIATDGLRVDYRVAPPSRLHIERAVLAWCGGTIESGPVSLSPSASSVDVTLKVRDLNLARMLQQLDLAEGSGEGTLRGTIPLRWSKGKIDFGKTSLASPPGQSGIIRFKNLQGTQDLFSALPAESPQRTQLDIALEALKDYTYRSIALQLESQADILLLQLQLDGKPNRLMPFAYDEALGRLKRVEGEGLAEFKGIAIDLNFRSPLNEFLNYRELLKTK